MHARGGCHDDMSARTEPHNSSVCLVCITVDKSVPERFLVVTILVNTYYCITVYAGTLL